MTENMELYMRGHSARMACIEIERCPGLMATDLDITDTHDETTCDWCRGWAAAEQELFRGAKP